MPDYIGLKERLDRGDTIIHDAAVTTELQSMGVPMDHVAWSGPSNYTHPTSIIQCMNAYKGGIRNNNDQYLVDFAAHLGACWVRWLC